MATKRILTNMRNKSILFLVLVSVLLTGTVVAEKARVITPEELASKTGKDGGGDLWMSIMGEVYDVSSGKEFYGEGGPYSIFSGLDGSVPFITGVFTKDEAKKGIDVLEPRELLALDKWRSFYEEGDKYPFIGLLEGDLYDKDGQPTDMLKKAREQIAEAKVVADAKQKERDEKVKQREQRQKATEL
jgi:predicted heme/steroid binding protein